MSGSLEALCPTGSAHHQPTSPTTLPRPPPHPAIPTTLPASPRAQITSYIACNLIPHLTSNPHHSLQALHAGIKYGTQQQPSTPKHSKPSLSSPLFPTSTSTRVIFYDRGLPLSSKQATHTILSYQHLVNYSHIPDKKRYREFTRGRRRVVCFKLRGRELLREPWDPTELDGRGAFW